MYGWMGKILRVNLSNGEINAETLDPQIARDFVGGRVLMVDRQSVLYVFDPLA